MNRYLAQTIQKITVSLCISFVLPFSLSAQVLITEIQYDPASKKDSGYEWFEIVNSGSRSVDVTTFRLFEGKTNHFIKQSNEAGKELAPGEVGVIVQDAGIFSSEYPDISVPIFLSKFSLRQQSGIGEEVGIYNTKTKQYDFLYSYKPDPISNGTGATLHIVDGEQHPAPATPGIVAINPIVIDKPAVQDEVETTEEIAEEIPEQKPLEDTVKEELKESSTPPPPSPISPSTAEPYTPKPVSFINPPDQTTSTVKIEPQTQKESEPLQQTTASRNTIPNNTILLLWLAIAITIIAINLIVMNYFLFRLLGCIRSGQPPTIK